MPIQHVIHMHDPKEIKILRDDRQRKIFTIDDLKESIPKRGQINPILVTPPSEGLVLIAGERRLTTFLELPELGQIACIYGTDISSVDLKILELEENLKRQDLSWPEHCAAILEIHQLYSTGTDWSLAKSGALLGYEYPAMFRMTEVAKEIAAGGEYLLQSSGWTTAYTALEVRRERKRETAKAELHKSIAEDFAEIDSFSAIDVAVIISEGETQAEEVKHPELKSDPHPFQNVDSVQWMKDYRGVPFNMAHCDFPYGIDIQDSDQANAAEHGTYEDSPEIYWELLHTFLANRDRLLSPQAHIIFWFSPKFYVETRDFFEKHAPDLWVQDIPLVWLKSDNRGIVADVQRRPRNITEFAFLLSRGDRKLLKAVANAYAAPTSRVIHQSEKPIPVLKHFFQMLVDENTRLLDPTSGSGNALVAADSFGASTLVGLEREPEYFQRSVQAWEKYRKLKQASEVI